MKFRRILIFFGIIAIVMIVFWLYFNNKSIDKIYINQQVEKQGGTDFLRFLNDNNDENAKTSNQIPKTIKPLTQTAPVSSGKP